MNIKKATQLLLIALVSVSSALFGSESMAMRINGCKGAVLCPSFPLAAPDEDCCQLWHVDVGLLYQQPGFSGMTPGVEYKSLFVQADTTSTTFSNQLITNLTKCFDYDLGLTVGLGHLSKHDHWFVGANFDWMSSNTACVYDDVNAQYKASGQLDIDVLKGSGFSISANHWQKIKYSAAVNFYKLDVTLSRGSYMGRCYSFEPFMGVKVAWFDTEQRANYHSTGSSGIFTTAGNYAYFIEKQSNWGAGIMFGFNGDYGITEMISLYCDSDVSVLYGEANDTITSVLTKATGTSGTGSTITTDRVITTKTLTDCHYYVPVRSILGAKIASYCLEDQHYVALKIGYDARAFISYTDVNRGFVMSGLIADFVWNF